MMVVQHTSNKLKIYSLQQLREQKEAQKPAQLQLQPATQERFKQPQQQQHQQQSKSSQTDIRLQHLHYFDGCFFHVGEMSIQCCSCKG